MKKALFLDRDGVVNIEKNYVFKIEEFEFLDGIFEVCRQFAEEGHLIFIITNQAGIDRGFYTVSDFQKLTSWMLDKFKEMNVNITKVFYCPHHPEFSGDCDCRKPKPKMILEAKKEFDIDLQESILIGDKLSDVEAGIAAGIKNNYLLAKDRPPKVALNTPFIKLITSLFELLNRNKQ